MVCSDNVCNRQTEKPDEAPLPTPPSPAPSYREFAPPGYDTVMKKHKHRIFLISTGVQETFTQMMEPPPPPTPTVLTPPETINSITLASAASQDEEIELAVFNNNSTDPRSRSRSRRSSTSSNVSNRSMAGDEMPRVVQVEVSVINGSKEVPSVIVVVNERRNSSKSDDSRSVTG